MSDKVQVSLLEEDWSLLWEYIVHDNSTADEEELRRIGNTIATQLRDNGSIGISLIPWGNDSSGWDPYTTTVPKHLPDEKPEFAGDPRFIAVTQALVDMHDRKQRDYGKTDDPYANVRASADWAIPGWIGALIRNHDKTRRMQKAVGQVMAGEEISMANESLADTFIDSAVYLIIAYILYCEEYGVEIVS